MMTDMAHTLRRGPRAVILKYFLGRLSIASLTATTSLEQRHRCE
jgi:hypothetical protein